MGSGCAVNGPDGLLPTCAQAGILGALLCQGLDPWQALNPRSLWLLVLLISGLSLVGYVLPRLLGAHRGLPVTGLTGGLVSSTAVTLSFARQSREPQYAAAGTAIRSPTKPNSDPWPTLRA